METLPTIQNTSLSVQDQQMYDLISKALDGSLPVETLERLLAMRDKMEAKYAREEFYNALSAFQAECPVIIKRKQGAVAKYAPLEDIVAQVKHLISKHGFSYTITSETFEDRLTAHCEVTHKAGHSKVSSFTSHKIKGNNAISLAQIDAGTYTFTKRYAFCGAFGIMTGDEDTDATKVDTFITEESILRIKELLTLTGFYEDQLLKAANVSGISELKEDYAQRVIINLEKRLDQLKAKGL